MSFPRYPEYKDSKVEWLGEVPAHWNIQPLKFVTTCNDDILPDSTPDDCQLKYVEISDVDEQFGITGWTDYRFANAPSRARRVVRHGDVLISTVRTYLRAIAPVVNPPENLVASTGFAAIRPMPGRFHSGLLGYTLRADWFISSVIARSVGVSYPAINSTDLIDMQVPTPPIVEQAAIAAFLDHETARIDALVAEQQRLIELLKEKRQAVISHAVTKGLNPDVPMKDSGVEWLGEVPAHWELAALRWFVRCSSGEAIASNQVQNDGGDGLFSVVGGNGAIGYCDSQNVPSGSIVIGRVGALCGNVHLIESPSWVTDNALWLELDKRKLIAGYVKEILLVRKLNELASKTAQPLITSSQVKDQVVPIPPLHEQHKISRWLARELPKVSDLVRQAQKGIEFLKERRSALISAAVTGKIDVRGWQPPPGSSSSTEATATEPA